MSILNEKRTDRVKTVKCNKNNFNMLLDNIDDLTIKLKCLYAIKNGTIYIRPYVFIHSENEEINYCEAIINPKFEICKFILRVSMSCYVNKRNLEINRTQSYYNRIDDRLKKLFNSKEFYNILDKKILDELSVSDDIKIGFNEIIDRKYLNLDHYSIDNDIIKNNNNLHNDDISIRFDKLIDEYRKIGKLKDLNDGEIISRGIKCLLNSINKALNEGLNEIKELYKERYVINKLNDLKYFKLDD